MRWVCPTCEREFGVPGQSHDCRPGLSVATLLDRHPPWVAAVYAAVLGHLHGIGPVHEDAVDVGIFLKSDRKLAEFRPLVHSARLGVYLPRRVTDERFRRVVAVGAGRYAHVIALTRSDQVDVQVRDWLSEAYLTSTDGAVSAARASPGPGPRRAPESRRSRTPPAAAAPRSVRSRARSDRT